MKKFKILDCTFRDGGYYNRWKFPHHVVQKQLYICSQLKIEYLEIGFRFYKPDIAFGDNAFTSLDYLASFKIPNNIKVSVMSNASDLLLAEKNRDLNKIYPGKKKDKKIDLIRIACHFHEFFNLKNIIKILIGGGYQVGLNLMQISNYNLNEIETFINFCNNNSITICYFADSLGSLDNKRTEKIAKHFKIKSKIPFGVHLHNNLGLALSNSLIAVENGAEFVDASVTGMGRGPGNTILEELIIDREKIFNSNKFRELNYLISNFYFDLKRKYKWGKNTLYFLAAKKNIHPTFIQELDNIKDLDLSDKFSLIAKISKLQFPNKYSEKILWELFIPDIGSLKSSKSKTFLNKNILLLGPSANKYMDSKSELNYFINQNKAKVICLNDHNHFYEDIINYRIFSNILRYSKLKSYKKDIISPFHKRKKSDISYKIKISDRYKHHNDMYEMKKPYVLPYTFSFLLNQNINSIIFFGFDGLREFEDLEILDSAMKFTKKFNKIYTLSNTDFNFMKKISFFDKIK